MRQDEMKKTQSSKNLRKKKKEYRTENKTSERNKKGKKL